MSALDRVRSGLYGGETPDYCVRALAPLSLLGIFGVAAYFAVPCHWMPMALDPEFSGWVAPISNRFAEGMVLYTDGGHSPLPPLPFVLLYALGRGHAVWLTESATNAGCQALMALAIFAALRRAIGPTLAWLAVLGAMPIFLAMPKSLAYDAVVQCLVATFGWSFVGWLAARTRVRLAVLAIIGGMMLLAKQNTAAGALAGALLAIAVLVPGMAKRDRLTALFGLGAGSLASAALGLLALSRYADPAGFVTDVLLTGSEPKGGPALLLDNLGITGNELLAYVPWFLAGGVLVALLGNRAADRDRPAWIVPAIFGALVAVILLLRLPGPFGYPREPVSVWLGDLPFGVLKIGLAAAIVGCALTAARRAAPAVVTLSALTAIWLLAAVTHSLSVALFRWTYDNNPLIAVAVSWPLLAIARAPHLVAATAIAAFHFTLWSTLGPTIDRWRSCTDPWPDVPTLAGARMPARASGLHGAVFRVRALASPTDTVLVLPNDPDFELMLGRPRPRLSSAILFVDQYWDRYVDDDVARLEASPPAVIVLGPAHNLEWQRAWNGEHTRIHRLITRVAQDLLPAYTRQLDQPITRMNGVRDALQIWVRRPGR
jgi:hypothetical protein